MEPMVGLLRLAVKVGAGAGERVATAWRRGRPPKTRLVKMTRSPAHGSGIRTTPTPAPVSSIDPSVHAGYSGAAALHQERKDVLREIRRLEGLRLMVDPQDTPPLDRDLAYQRQLLADVDARILAARAETEQLIRDCEINLEQFEVHDPRYAETEEALEAAQAELAALGNYTTGRH